MALGITNVAIVAMMIVMARYGNNRAWFRRWLLSDVMQALGATWGQMFGPKNTVEFPEAQTPRSERFRGLLALRRYDSGAERCIACHLCEVTCPAVAITIESEVKDNHRYASRFDIDAFKCIHCGLCEDACPVDAIVLTNQEHVVYTQRGDNILSKDVLLGFGDVYAPSDDVTTQETK
jgi:NADH-quinone oxidoreductase subunit I